MPPAGTSATAHSSSTTTTEVTTAVAKAPSR